MKGRGEKKGETERLWEHGMGARGPTKLGEKIEASAGADRPTRRAASRPPIASQPTHLLITGPQSDQQHQANDLASGRFYQNQKNKMAFVAEYFRDSSLL